MEPSSAIEESYNKKVKENKTLEQHNKAGDRIDVVLSKFSELEKENATLNATIKLWEKRSEAVLKEKENLQKEYNKSVLMRDKLEQVCREQQKLIKAVKNESLTKIREEEERRKENQSKFQQSINEISVKLNKNNEENIKLREDNIEMTKKLMFLTEQCKVREKQVEKINEQVKLETQLNEAKLAKIKMESTIEKEILLKEKQEMLEELVNSKKIIQELQNHEELLKEQIALYSSKHNDFQMSLQRSSDVFTNYKTEIEKMCKNMKKLERESLEWKTKWQKSNASLIELATDKQVKENYIARMNRQMEQLQKLLRTMQAERAVLYKTLKDNNIEKPPIPTLPAKLEQGNVSFRPLSENTDKLDLMVKNCSELKQNLAQLQNQMNEITQKQSAKNTTTEDSKKNKNKKKKKNVCPIKNQATEPEASIKPNAALNNSETTECLEISNNIENNLEDKVEENKINEAEEENNENSIESNIESTAGSNPEANIEKDTNTPVNCAEGGAIHVEEVKMEPIVLG